jgi:hypothetical protein
MKRSALRLAHGMTMDHKRLRFLRDARGRRSSLHSKENTTMKLVKMTFAVSMLAVLAMLSGCIFVPVGPGYYSGSHGYYGGYEGRGGRGYR